MTRKKERLVHQQNQHFPEKLQNKKIYAEHFGEGETGVETCQKWQESGTCTCKPWPLSPSPREQEPTRCPPPRRGQGGRPPTSQLRDPGPSPCSRQPQPPHPARPGPQPHTSPQPPPQMAEPGPTLIPGAPAPSSGLPGNWARTAPAKPLPAPRRWVLFAERTRVQRHPGQPALRIAREPGQVVPTPPWSVPVKGPDSWGDFVGLETAG